MKYLGFRPVSSAGIVNLLPFLPPPPPPPPPPPQFSQDGGLQLVTCIWLKFCPNEMTAWSRNARRYFAASHSLMQRMPLCNSVPRWIDHIVPVSQATSCGVQIRSNHDPSQQALVVYNSNGKTRPIEKIFRYIKMKRLVENWIRIER